MALDAIPDPNAPGKAPEKFTFTGPDGTVREATPEQILQWQAEAARAAEKEKGADAKFREAAEKLKNAEAQLSEAESALQLEADLQLCKKGDEGALRRVYVDRLGESPEAVDQYIRMLKNPPAPGKEPPVGNADKPANVSDSEWTELKEVAKSRGMTVAQLVGTLTDFVGASAADQGLSEVQKILVGVLADRAKSGKMIPRTQQARDLLAQKVYQAVTASVASKRCRWGQESIVRELENELYLLDDAAPGKAAPSGPVGFPTGLDPIGPSSDAVPDYTQDETYPKMDMKKVATDPNYIGRLIAVRQEWKRARGIPDGQM